MSVTFNGLGLRIWVVPEHFTAAADFYRDLLGLECSWRDDARHVATYELGSGPTLVLEAADAASDEEHGQLAGRLTGICLGVADVEATYRTLKDRGLEFIGEPEKQYWGGVMAHFRDPGGNLLTLLEQPGKG